MADPSNEQTIHEDRLPGTLLNPHQMEQGIPDECLHMEEEEVPAEELRTTGQVKWFNDVDGYGFIRPTDNSGDIFVHISDIEPVHNNFKPSLYTGEYVSFGITTNGTGSDGSMRLKATHVKGVFGGTLMCDHGQIEFKSYSRVGFGNNATATTTTE